MSAILSADDLNDFISPSVACIKPVEALPYPSSTGVYEVTTEDKLHQEDLTAQISLSDCLACSGCVTSAEAVLVSLQSHAEVQNALDTFPPFRFDQRGDEAYAEDGIDTGKIFVASVSPQVRASLAATFCVTEAMAGNMIEQLLGGPRGLASGGRHGNRFTWTIDTDAIKDLLLTISSAEVLRATSAASQAVSGNPNDSTSAPKLPVLSSACPGWVCYAEKTHPHVLTHLSKVKSPQALVGTLIKTTLARCYEIDPARIWHLAIMPCFDKKLEASRQELTDHAWSEFPSPGSAVRDVDCVVTAREILMLAESRGIRFMDLATTPLPQSFPFPNRIIGEMLFREKRPSLWRAASAGTSGGHLYQILKLQQEMNPGSEIVIERGRNTDVMEYNLSLDGKSIFKGARYYGFRNIQNLVRKLKPARAGQFASERRKGAARRPGFPSVKDMDYSYIEVMACPGGCTNGGGQIKVADLEELNSPVGLQTAQKEWLNRVDEAYFSEDLSSEETSRKSTENPSPSCQELATTAENFITYWSDFTSIPKDKLLYTSYRQVESDVGKSKQDTEQVAVLAGKIGGGW